MPIRGSSTSTLLLFHARSTLFLPPLPSSLPCTQPPKPKAHSKTSSALSYEPDPGLPAMWGTSGEGSGSPEPLHAQARPGMESAAPDAHISSSALRLFNHPTIGWMGKTEVDRWKANIDRYDTIRYATLRYDTIRHDRTDGLIDRSTAEWIVR